MAMSSVRATATLEDSLDIGGTGVFIWLHVGSPGAAGTANVAQTGVPANIVRKTVDFGAVQNNPSENRRQSLSDEPVSWSGAEIDSGQEITHFSVWSAETDGQCEYIAALATPKTTGSDGVTADAGDLVVEIQVFAKP